MLPIGVQKLLHILFFQQRNCSKDVENIREMRRIFNFKAGVFLAQYYQSRFMIE